MATVSAAEWLQFFAADEKVVHACRWGEPDEMFCGRLVAEEWYEVRPTDEPPSWESVRCLVCQKVARVFLRQCETEWVGAGRRRLWDGLRGAEVSCPEDVPRSLEVEHEHLRRRAQECAEQLARAVREYGLEGACGVAISEDGRALTVSVSKCPFHGSHAEAELEDEDGDTVEERKLW